MKANAIFLFVVMITSLLFHSTLVAQKKVDTDSLFYSARNDINKLKDYDSAIKKSHVALKIAPNYLDFHLLLGLAFRQKKENDSARYHFNYIIEKNPNDQDAFLLLINLNIEAARYEEALATAEKALALHPNEKTFFLKKMVILQLKNDEKQEYGFLKSVQLQFSDNEEFKQRLFYLESKIDSDRIGINYSFTTFNRANYGPWHLSSLQYIRERSWGSLIGRVNYANRLAFGDIANGVQYEAESYIFTGKKSYSYLGAAYSNDLVFPNWRLGYSFFYNFRKGWEADVGLRYTKLEEQNFMAGVLGVGKYIGSYWINFRAFIQKNEDAFYPAYTFTGRYYFGTRFDYAAVIAGYGTSPDERTTLGQFGQRVGLESYRVGAGFYKVLGKHFITGTQAIYNRQEFAIGLKQNEIELSIMLQYKF